MTGERFLSGDLRPVRDCGTPEHRQKRQQLVGPAPDTRTPQRIARHEALASTPLGVLYARGLISEAHLYAGRRYAGLFARAVRPLTLPSVLAGMIGGGGAALAMAVLDQMATMETHPVTRVLQPSGSWDREQYLAAREALDRCGPLVANAVDDLVIYEHAPRTEMRLAAIRECLDALARHFELVDARTRAGQG